MPLVWQQVIKIHCAIDCDNCNDDKSHVLDVIHAFRCRCRLEIVNDIEHSLPPRRHAVTVSVIQKAREPHVEFLQLLDGIHVCGKWLNCL